MDAIPARGRGSRVSQRGCRMVNTIEGQTTMPTSPGELVAALPSAVVRRDEIFIGERWDDHSSPAAIRNALRPPEPCPVCGTANCT